MMGMTIERCARSGPKKLTKTYNKGFPNHSTLISTMPKACSLAHEALVEHRMLWGCQRNAQLCSPNCSLLTNYTVIILKYFCLFVFSPALFHVTGKTQSWCIIQLKLIPKNRVEFSYVEREITVPLVIILLF